MRIRTRLILALSSLALAVVLAVMVLLHWRIDQGLNDYFAQRQQARLEAVAGRLAERWEDDPHWEQLAQHGRAWQRLLDDTDDDHERRRGHDGDAHRPPPPPLPFVLLDAQGRVVVGRPPADLAGSVRVPVVVDGVVVGEVVAPPLVKPASQRDRGLRATLLRSLWLVGGLALLMAVPMAILLARNFTRPLQQLSRATHTLTRQRYAIDVDTARRDELGDLARDLRELARTLESTAGARQRWFADISHELRTPLAVLQGEVEAMLDGVRPIDRARILSLQAELQHLMLLVSDLYDLARADVGGLQYRKTDVDLGELLRARLAQLGGAFATAGLALEQDIGAAPLVVDGDPDRLQQLVDNLLQNSLRYTDRGGRVRVTLARRGGSAVLAVEDSAPGVPDAALPHLFDHLFRVDSARSRSSGGAGLGLAICLRIAEGHGGTLAAAHSALGGLAVTASLPLAGSNA